MQIVAIQILRALAALAVAIGHGQSFIGIPMEKLGEPFGWSHLLPWGAGVDLFFVISGFIMVYSSERLFAAAGGAYDFIWRRLSRIVPLYWIATIFVIVTDVLRHRPAPDAASVVASFLFIPWGATGTRQPHPVYELGWTLNYEMFFYAIFALAIGFRREAAVGLIAAALALLTLAGLATHISNPQWLAWTQAITLEFVFGMGVALLARRGLVLSRLSRYLLIGVGAAALFCDFLDSAAQSSSWITPNDLSRVLAWGLPAAMIVMGAALGERTANANNALTRFGKALGDSSYAFYLCHPILMSAFSMVWFALALDKRLPAYLGVGVSVAAACGLSLVVHRWLEKPLTLALQRARPKQRGLGEARSDAGGRVSPSSVPAARLAQVVRRP
jgi:exopolysaccharide production protein ExoZ